MDWSVVVVETVVDEVVNGASWKHCRCDFSQRGIYLGQAQAKLRDKFPATQQMRNLTYYLILRNVPG